MSSEPLNLDLAEGSSRVREAADKLERHIRASGLRAGDRYITAEQAAQLIGGSVMTVQRAMKLLAGKNILERRPKAGTFIGSAAAPSSELSCIHFFLPEQFVKEGKDQESFWPQIHGQIYGMRTVLPNLSIQFNFIPNQDLAYTRQIVQQAAPDGVILVLASRAMRAFFDQSGIPTVVEGSVEPDLTNLCWIDWDQIQTGRILAAYLLKRGHRRLATVMRNVWSIGEHQLHDGISEELSAAGLGATALCIRSAPPEGPAICELARSLLTATEPPPTGFICRTEFQADCLSSVINELGQADRIDVTVCNPPESTGSVKYPTVSPDTEAIGQGRIIGNMFQNLMRHTPAEPRGLQVAVRLQLPEGRAKLT